MALSLYSIGTGDRFGLSAKAQLEAVIEARQQGLELDIVWNKSMREHRTIGSHPGDVLASAKVAVQQLNYKGRYFIDADHIELDTVDDFLESSNFFTLDVSRFIASSSNSDVVGNIASRMLSAASDISDVLPGVELGQAQVENLVGRYQGAVKEASRIYQKIKAYKKDVPFVAELSLDETSESQSAIELYVILYLLDHYRLPVEILAPKFPGEFYKGVDYVGQVVEFENIFQQMLIVLAGGKQHLNLHPMLKLSVHTGSDKFSLYPIMNRLIKKHSQGLHLKTAGTTWLEEFVALVGGQTESQVLAKSIAKEALSRIDELAGPYAHVVDINPDRLPGIDQITSLEAGELIAMLRHNSKESKYNPDFRQLIHLAYKIAAERGEVYLDQLKKESQRASDLVKENLLEKHIVPLFGPL